MRDLPCFIKVGDDRINIDDISSYGLGTDFDDDTDEEYRYLYIQTKTDEEFFQFNEDEVDFDLDTKLAELDSLFLYKNF